MSRYWMHFREAITLWALPEKTRHFCRCTWASQNIRRTALHWALWILLVRLLHKEKGPMNRIQSKLALSHLTSSPVLYYILHWSKERNQSHFSKVTCVKRTETQWELCRAPRPNVRTWAGERAGALSFYSQQIYHPYGAAAHYPGIFQLHPLLFKSCFLTCHA